MSEPKNEVLTQDQVDAQCNALHDNEENRKLMQHWWRMKFGAGQVLEATGVNTQKYIDQMLETIMTKEEDKKILTDFIKEKGL